MRKGTLLRLILTVLTLGFILGLSLPALQVEAVIGLPGISSAEKVYAPGNEIRELRGRAHRVYQGEIPTTFVAEFVGSPEFTRSIADNSWVEYGFSDYGDFYSVQHPWWSVAFYDYYTTVYDETFTEVKIYDDRWVVEYLNEQGNWTNSSFWGVVRSYEIVEDGIKLIRIGNTIIGQREEIYYFRNGSPCKIEIKQTCNQAQTIRFVWKPSGIVADTERQIIPDEYDKHAGKVSGLNYYDSTGKFVQTMRWYVELDTCDTIIPVVEAGAQGRKATVTFGGFAINAGGIAHLDPDTFYPDVGGFGVDGNVGKSTQQNWDTKHDGAGTEHRDTQASETFVYLSSTNNAYVYLFRGIFVYDTTSLPDSCTILAAVHSLYGTSKTNSLYTPTIGTYTSDPASNNDIVNADYLYTNFGTTDLSNIITFAAFDTAGYNDFTLLDVDEDGFGYISKTIETNLGTRLQNSDVVDVGPGTTSGSSSAQFSGYFSEQGVGYKPKLVVTYTTVDPPTVTTQAASSIEDTTATGNANITVTGGENCDMRGGAWSTSTQGDPGAAEPPEDYGTGNATVHGAFGTGAFTVSMTGLPTGDTIYFRPYAHNSAGWNWGSEVSFLTKPAAPTNVAASSNDETKVVITWTKSTGATDYHVFRGVVDLGAAGDVATFDDGGATAGTITNAGTVTASDGSQTAHVVLNLASEATGVTEHTYKVVASNASGDSDDSNTDNGNRSVGAITYQWQVNDGGGYDNIVGGTTDPYNDTAAPAGTISNAGNVTASDGTSTAHVTLSLASEATTDGAAYDYQCIVSASGASNSPQTSDSNNGYRTVGAITYQWQRSAADSDAGYSNIGGGTTDPYNDTVAPAGVITPGTASATDGTDTAKVVLSLAGESVTDGAGRYFQCIVSSVDASNSPQTSTNNRGYRTTGAITYQWQRSAADSSANYSNIDGATTDPYNDTAVPAGIITHGTITATDGDSTAHVVLSNTGESVDVVGRYFQCIVSATGATQQTSTNDRGYRGVGALTYAWYRSAADSDAAYGAIGGATTDPYNDTGAPAPSITAGDAVATDGDYTDKVALSLAGTSSNDGDGRYYKCYHTATGAESGFTGNNRGYRGGGALSYQWEVDRGAGFGNIGGATASTYNDVAAPQGTISNSGTASASDGAVEAHVVLSLAGEATTDGATNDYRCTLTAPNAAGQTSGANTGYRTVGTITFQWYRSQTDADSAPWDSIVGGTTDPYNDTAAPESGAGRWFYCVVSSVDADNTPQNSTHDRGYRFVALVVITNPCTGSDALWAIVNGEIIAGSNPITQTGFEYGLTDTYGANQTVNGTWVRGDEFWKKLTALTPATVYHYRAMAYDDSWAYGEDRVFSTSGSATIYENLNTGGTDNSSAICAANWTAMQFTSDNVSHTVTSIRVPLMRVGDTPGTVTLAITHADSDNFSTGADLGYAVLNGNAMTTGYVWYDFDITDITLDSNSKYVIVVKALSGSDTDYILWSANTTGILDDAVGSHSTDSGISWTTDSPTDYLFEIWGDTAISLEGAQVFSTYIEEGDWLFTLTYKNTYTPYYPNEDPKAYFYLQLIDDTTVKAQVNCPMWGYKPGSIYIAKSLADTLEWGSTDYKIRLVGSFSSTPYTDYALEELDWKGDEPTFLDRWVIAQANSIGDYYDTALTVDIADLGEVLNAEGHTMFSIGIPELNVVRPDLFEMVVRQPGYEETDWTHELPGATDWEVRLGPQISGVLTEWGNLINVDGKGVGGFLTFVAFMLVLCLLTLFGNVVVGLCLSYPILLGGAWFGVIDWVLLGVMTFAVAVVFVYKVFLIK